MSERRGKKDENEKLMSLKSNKDENKINGPYTGWRQIITSHPLTTQLTIRVMYRGHFLSVCKSFYEMMTGEIFNLKAALWSKNI